MPKFKDRFKKFLANGKRVGAGALAAMTLFSSFTPKLNASPLITEPCVKNTQQAVKVNNHRIIIPPQLFATFMELKSENQPIARIYRRLLLLIIQATEKLYGNDEEKKEEIFNLLTQNIDIKENYMKYVLDLGVRGSTYRTDPDNFLVSLFQAEEKTFAALVLIALFDHDNIGKEWRKTLQMIRLNKKPPKPIQKMLDAIKSEWLPPLDRL